MIEYVIAHNPDDRVLAKASKFLSEGKLICFPTDTNWILSACSLNKAGVEKLYKIKKENKQKHFSLLCSDISSASDVALIDNTAFKLLKKTTPGHYTFIFEATRNFAKLMQASKTDKEVGVRFVPSELVKALVSHHGNPLVSTNIPRSMLGMEEDSVEPIYSYQLEDVITPLVEMIIDPGEIEFAGQSTIVDFSQGTGPMLVRQGAGEASYFIS